MFDSLVYLFDTRKRSGYVLVPSFVARLVCRLRPQFDFGGFDAARPVV